jgi:predicted transglutaminase-like cysteine proteinase
MAWRFASSLTIIAGVLGLSDPAFGLVVDSLPVDQAALPVQCDSMAELPQVASLVGATGTTKSAQILGGQVSALERIMQAQGGAAAASVPTIHVAALPGDRGASGRGLLPAAGGINCGRFAMPRAISPGGLGRGLGTDDFLLTRRLAVGRTAFDADWVRVSSAGLSARVVQKLVPQQFRGAPLDLALIEGINAWANQRIRYVEDAKLFGRADFWAKAETTLRNRAGDCEDIAILKMQVLAAMGVPRSSMFLTIARDLTRRTDHALLVVRFDDRFWVLDNATDRMLDANDSLDYQPVLSFSGERKWLHGAVMLALN